MKQATIFTFKLFHALFLLGSMPLLLLIYSRAAARIFTVLSIGVAFLFQKAINLKD